MTRTCLAWLFGPGTSPSCRWVKNATLWPDVGPRGGARVFAGGGGGQNASQLPRPASKIAQVFFFFFYYHNGVYIGDRGGGGGGYHRHVLNTTDRRADKLKRHTHHTHTHTHTHTHSNTHTHTHSRWPVGTLTLYTGGISASALWES